MSRTARRSRWGRLLAAPASACLLAAGCVHGPDYDWAEPAVALPSAAYGVRPTPQGPAPSAPVVAIEPDAEPEERFGPPLTPLGRAELAASQALPGGPSAVGESPIATPTDPGAGPMDLAMGHLGAGQARYRPSAPLVAPDPEDRPRPSPVAPVADGPILPPLLAFDPLEGRAASPVEPSPTAVDPGLLRAASPATEPTPAAPEPSLPDLSRSPERALYDWAEAIGDPPAAAATTAAPEPSPSEPAPERPGRALPASLGLYGETAAGGWGVVGAAPIEATPAPGPREIRAPEADPPAPTGNPARPSTPSPGVPGRVGPGPWSAARIDLGTAAPAPVATPAAPPDLSRAPERALYDWATSIGQTPAPPAAPEAGTERSLPDLSRSPERGLYDWALGIGPPPADDADAP